MGNDSGNAYNRIVAAINYIRKTKLLFTLLHSSLLFFIICICFCIILCAIDFLVPLPVFVKYIFWLCILFFGIATVLHVVQQAFTREEKIILLIQEKFPFLSDDLINAWYLGQDTSTNVSAELRAKFLEQVADKISHLPIKEIISGTHLHSFIPHYCIAIAVSLFLYFYPPYILRTTLPDILLLAKRIALEEMCIISPKNAKVIWGSNVTISITPKSAQINLSSAELVMHFGEGTWEKVFLKPVENSLTYSLFNITTRVEYYLLCHNFRSQKYTIEPIPVPQIGNFTVYYYFPAYTNLTRRISNTLGDIPCLRGTVVEFEAISNSNLSKATLLTSYGKKIPLHISEKRVSGKFILEQTCKCWFELITVDNVTNIQPQKYLLQVVSDNAPEITIISPAQDLVISPETKVPILYRADDDYGIRQVELYYQVGDLPEKKVIVHRAIPSQRSYTGEYLWNMKSIEVSSGDIVEYYLSVVDNDTVFGPKSSHSKIYKIEIFSYIREHEAIEFGLRQFRDNLLKILSEQLLNKQTLDKAISEGKMSTETYKNILVTQEKIPMDTTKVASELKDLLSRMELDPYTNLYILTEHKYIQAGLEQLVEKQMKDAITAIQDNNFTEATSLQEDIISTLERMNMLAEDVFQQQRMQDLISSSEKLTGLCEDILNGLRTGPDATKLSQTLSQIEQLISQIQHLLQKLPQELPEDFINQRAIKEINFEHTTEFFQQLKQSITSGDFSNALAAAEQLLQHLQNILTTIQSSALQANNSSFGSAYNLLQKEAVEKLSELENIISEQNSIISKTDSLEKKRQEKLFNLQEKILAELAERQKKVITETESLQIYISKLSQEYYPTLAYLFSQCLPLMRQVYQEFTNKQIVNSHKYLTDIIARCAIAEKNAADYLLKISTSATEYSSYCYTHSQIHNIKHTEQEILDILQSTPEVKFNPSDKDTLNKLSLQQANLQNKTATLCRSLQEFARKTATVTPQLCANLRNASKEMSSASNNLLEQKTDMALYDEQEALEYLTKGKEGLQQVLQELLQMQASGSQPVAGFLQGTSGGIAGFRIAPVKLPDINDYIPPEEFREEILRSLKEKYPQEYEEYIKEYFKKLTE